MSKVKALFSSPKIDLPPEPPPVPTAKDPSVAAKKEEARLAAVKRKGFASLVNTVGLGDSSTSTNQEKLG